MPDPQEQEPQEQEPQVPPRQAKDDASPPENAVPGALEPDKSVPDSAPTAEQVPAEEKLADPAATGALPKDPAASVEKTAEAAALAPEGAQPAQPGAAAAQAAKPAAERPARPAKEAEPKTAPRVAPDPGLPVFAALRAAAPDVAVEAYMVPASPSGESVCVEVKPDDLPAVMTVCRDDPRLDLKYLRCLSGVDWQEEGLEVAYHLWSFTNRHHLTVKTRIPTAEAVVPSVTSIFPAAEWHERETRDMFGIVFDGHPNLVPLLLPEDITDHFPLRKDNPLQEIEEWQGENLSEGAGEDDE